MEADFYLGATELSRDGSDKLVSQEMDIKQLVQAYSTDSMKAESASITSKQLQVTAEDSSKETYDLPQDEFFVSIAPYIENTHPCATHDLIGCQGELVNKAFNVVVTDMDNNVIQQGTLTSHSNGFIDLWLPRERTYQIRIERDGKTAETQLSTFENDNTCIATMQLM